LCYRISGQWRLALDEVPDIWTTLPCPAELPDIWTTTVRATRETIELFTEQAKLGCRGTWHRWAESLHDS